MKKIHIAIISLFFLTQNLTAQIIKARNGTAIVIEGGAYIYAKGTVTLDNGTTLKNDGILTVENAGSVENSGTYTGSGAVFSGVFNNSGTVAPTNCLTFTNGFTNSGIVAIDLGGTTACALHDKINVIGTTATLGGTLNVTLANGYTGATNHIATIVQSTALSGTFSTINLPPSWFANYNNPSTGKMTLAFSSPLPVELLNFSGYTEGGQNFLVWTTANEINNKGFQIERLMDNGKWLILGFVESKGKAAMYDFTDKTPSSISYYRLRQIDNDGKETLSKVISLSNTAKSLLKVYPNPATDVLTVEFTKGIGAADKATDFEVMNVLGQIILRGPLNRSVDIAALPSGTYIVRLSQLPPSLDGGGLEQVKFVKQ